MSKSRKSLRSSFSAANDDKHIGLQNPSNEQLKRAMNPPHDDTAEVLHGVTVHDPFRPMEDITAPETVAWAARENARADAFLAQAKDFEDKANAFFDAALPHGMLESMPARYGDKYIVWRKEENEERYSIFVKDVPDYDAPARLLLSPAAIDPSGKTNIAQKYVSPDGKIMAYELSKSGSDSHTLKFMDIDTGKDIGLVYNDFRSAVQWDQDGQGFHYDRMVGNKSFEVCYHKMGTSPDDDVVIYNPGKPEMGAGWSVVAKDSSRELGTYEFISTSDASRDANGLLARPRGSHEEFKEIFPLKEGQLNPIAEINGKIYALTTFNAPNGRLVSFDVNDPSPDKWQDILPESTEDQITDVDVRQGKLYASYTHDTGGQLRVFTLDGQHLHDAPIPPLSTVTMGQWRPEDTTCFLTFDNFQEDGNIYQYDSEKNDLTLVKKSNTPIDLKDCIVERVYATSKDGTKVPMTVIRAPETKLDGTAATLLYGYGGFNNSLEPGFSPGIAQWVRSGGIYVQANLRGGGEYGQKWYDGGRGPNKQNVFDDFAACAEHLIKEKYTSAKRLAIQGGSNGGLLTLATMLQHPKLFGAVVSEVPVADMFRFHIGSYWGYSWKSDYGDPDVKKDFNVAAKYSPLHNVKPGLQHPPLLIKTDANDDRVLPWHSFKMAATMQAEEAPGAETYLKVRNDGGHSAGMTIKQWYADVASVHAFLSATLGPINQDEYKAKLKAERAAKRAPKGPKAA